MNAIPVRVWAVIGVVLLPVLCRLHVTVAHATMPALALVVVAELAACTVLLAVIVPALRTRPLAVCAYGGS